VVDPSEPREIYRDEDPARFQESHGARWIRSAFDVRTSDFGAKVAHLLDRVAKGIYHVSSPSLGRVKWDDNQCVEVTWHGSMSTCDDDTLTRLVFLCHELSVRAELEACGPQYLRIRFSRRIRNGSVFDGHPTIERTLILLRDLGEVRSA